MEVTAVHAALLLLLLGRHSPAQLTCAATQLP